MISPKLRRDFSDLMISDTGVVRNIDEKGKLRQSVDVYMSDFGDLMVVPNYIMGLTNNVRFTTSAGPGNNLAADTNVANFSALIYDPQWFAMASLRPLKEVDVGQKGDSTIGMMVEEATLEVRNPSGCGAIYGLA
jgi:cell division protein FtsI/penicillin-binding protein 2